MLIFTFAKIRRPILQQRRTDRWQSCPATEFAVSLLCFLVFPAGKTARYGRGRAVQRARRRHRQARRMCLSCREGSRELAGASLPAGCAAMPAAPFIRPSPGGASPSRRALGPQGRQSIDRRSRDVPINAAWRRGSDRRSREFADQRSRDVQANLAGCHEKTSQTTNVSRQQLHYSNFAKSKFHQAARLIHPNIVPSIFRSGFSWTSLCHIGAKPKARTIPGVSIRKTYCLAGKLLHCGLY